GDIAVLPESRGSGHSTNRENLIPTVIPSDRPILIRRSSVDSFIGLDAEPKVRTQFEGTSSKALAPQSTSSEPSRTDVSQDHAGKKQPDRVKTADSFILGVRQNVPSPATAVETVVLLHEVGKQQFAMFEVPSNSDQTRVSFDNETPVQRPDSSQKVRQHSIEGAPVVGPKQPSDLPNNSVGVFSNVSNGPRAQEISTAALSNNEERAIPPKTTTFDQADERSRLPDPLVHSKPDLASDRGAGGTPAASQALENLHGTRDEVKGATSMENGAFAGEAETRRVGASAINASGTADTKLGASLPVMTQLSEATRTASTGLIEVRLSPEELGRVKLFLSPSDAGLSVTFLTERPETMELIRRHVEIFANDLRLQGHQNLSFQFGQNNDPSSHLSNSDETQGELTSGEDQSSPPNIAHLPNKTAVDGRLDLRL
ncbi:MAG: flagellar hook-length control protein FliK, partial [Boseongicola sp.]|nr:flagellar hook-length control protein FliK [Boseongicola sp.]